MPQTATATDFIARVDASEARLAGLASSAPAPASNASPTGSEAEWDAGQVWAHIAELTPYWIGEARRIIANQGGSPVPFGRVPEDGQRDHAIELGRHRSAAEQWQTIVAGLADFRLFVGGLSEADWEAVGLHVKGDVRTVRRILTTTVVDHLDDHAAQLERLAGR